MQLPDTPAPSSRRFSLRDAILLAIVAGLGIILLLPTIGGHRDKKYRSTCQSNLKRLGISFFQYTRDYDETFPPATSGHSVTSGTARFGVPVNGWADAVQPWVKSLPQMQCGAEPTGANADPKSTGYSDYFYNAAFSWNRESDPKKVRWDRGVTAATVVQPEWVILLGDADITGTNGTARTRFNGFSSSGALDIRSPSPQAQRNGRVTARNFGGGGSRHMQGINLGFADGHVKWYSLKESVGGQPIYHFNSSKAVTGSNPTFNLFQP